MRAPLRELLRGLPFAVCVPFGREREGVLVPGGRAARRAG